MDQNFPSDAVETLASQVHDPVFFDKLGSDWNIHPRSGREKEQLLELGLLLRDAKEQETIKTASDGNQFLGGAIDSLRSALGDRGATLSPSQEAVAIKQAAANCVNNQQLQDAALAYGSYLISLSAGTK